MGPLPGTATLPLLGNQDLACHGTTAATTTQPSTLWDSPPPDPLPTYFISHIPG